MIRTDTELIYMAQKKDKQLFVRMCLSVCGRGGEERTGGVRESWLGVSPVDLEVEADLRSRVFQPLDRKPQTNRQLGKTQKRERMF